ncbi:hypothetical protein C8Q79DRAFT_1002798 [Trametes meyenii]|nr:hypothetical protein C8Q79DRAFT_1002798 [Trametes meyenii]
MSLRRLPAACIVNATTTLSAGNETTTSTSSNGTVISFPSITATATANASVTSLTTSVSLTSTPSVSSEFGFLTGSSLVVDQPTTTSSSATATLTNPDQPVTTFTLASSSSVAPDARPSQAPLPSGLPLQILPASGAHPGDPDLTGYSQISILFDTGLNWKFVAQHSDSSSQIFAWMSPILQAALNLGPTQVKTYELKVYVPDDYTGPNDIDLLQTMWLGYIPSDNVDLLAQQLKVTSSAFYTSLGAPYSQLAEHVISSFPVTNAVSGGSSGAGSGSDSGATAASGSSSSKTRENAIIGVVSSLGAIALLILAFLVFRAVKQRRELAHRRLSDPHQQEFVGAPPDDHEFDRDSVGGQRRRSFYYAADSLRGYEGQPQQQQQQQQQQFQQFQQQQQHAEDPFNSSMRERRPPIGAPILRDNTMDW